MSAAVIESLTVRYGKFTALDNFSVEVPEGCVGLLGPNGAGKTTLIKTLLGLVAPAAGKGQILGHDLATQGLRIRQMVGYMPEQDCHIPGMTGVQYVAFTAELAGLPSRQAMLRAHEVLEYSGLGEARYRQVETYSLGMKQRIKFAQALVHGPKLLLLDEPTNGLDPRGREEMLRMVKTVSEQEGVSVVVSSHLLVDIERTCDYVIVMTHGHLRTTGPISDLRGMMGGAFDVSLQVPDREFFAALGEQRGYQIEMLERGKCRVVGEGMPEDVSREIYAFAQQQGKVIRRLTPARRTLEDVFLEAIRD